MALEAGEAGDLAGEETITVIQEVVHLLIRSRFHKQLREEEVSFNRFKMDLPWGQAKLRLKLLPMPYLEVD